MTLFWIFALLLALVSAAVVALPLWRGARAPAQDMVTLNRRVFRERLAELEKDQIEGRIDAATLAELRTELERNLLTLQAERPDDSGPGASRRRLTALTLVLVPAVAAGFYYGVVAPRELGKWWTLRQEMGPAVDRLLSGQPLTDAETANHTLPDFIRLLQDRLQRQPADAEGWFMLGISYMQLNMGQPAQTALEHAWRLAPDEPRHALAYAQIRIFSNEGQLDATSRQLLEGVLVREPGHEGALVLLGFGAYRSGDHATAVTMLERLEQARAARGATRAVGLTEQLGATLADARSRLAAAKSGQVPAAVGAAIRVKVRIDRSLAGKYAPDDTLYIFARALNGPPMPLAVVKRRASDLPVTIELDDSQSMMPERPLSSVREVAVSARISRHGSPEPQPGDLEAIAVPVRQGSDGQDVELVIRNLR
jgi:cytochrome c-type biogenesis protein CcmH